MGTLPQRRFSKLDYFDPSDPEHATVPDRAPRKTKDKSEKVETITR
jgi:hypothetical protein